MYHSVNMKKQNLLYVLVLIIIIIAVAIYFNRQVILKQDGAYPVQNTIPSNNDGTVSENQINSNNSTNGGQYKPNQSSTTQYGGVTKDGDEPIISPSIVSLKIISPENNSSWKIGSAQTVKWELSGKIPLKYKYAIYLNDYIIAETNSSSTGKYSFVVPQTTMRGGSIVSIEPGNYKIGLAIFDGNTAPNQNSPLGKLVFKSSNTITIQVTK